MTEACQAGLPFIPFREVHSDENFSKLENDQNTVQKSNFQISSHFMKPMMEILKIQVLASYDASFSR